MSAPTTKVPPAFLSHARIPAGGKHSLILQTSDWGNHFGPSLCRRKAESHGSNSWAAASETTSRKPRGRAAITRLEKVSNAFVIPADSR